MLSKLKAERIPLRFFIIAAIVFLKNMRNRLYFELLARYTIFRLDNNLKIYKLPIFL